jgi:hypothetical protein
MAAPPTYGCAWFVRQWCGLSDDRREALSRGLAASLAAMIEVCREDFLDMELSTSVVYSSRQQLQEGA